MNRFSIKDIENLTGIKAHTLRIWEQRYQILQPKRTATNIRFYDGEDLKLALKISLLNNYGYKISRIQKMNLHDMNTLIGKISDAAFKLQILTNELLEAALQMDIMQFEHLLNHHIDKHGIESTIEGPIFQFLEKAGILWMTDNLIPAQEHLASNILYRKLAVAIDNIRLSVNGTKFLLFLPEGEIHELALMYVQFLLRKNGHVPFYLGQNTPMQEVVTASESLKPEFIYSHLTSISDTWDGNKYLSKLSASVGDVKLLVSGPILHNLKSESLKKVHCLNSLQEVRDFISAI